MASITLDPFNAPDEQAEPADAQTPDSESPSNMSSASTSGNPTFEVDQSRSDAFALMQLTGMRD